MRAKPFRPDAMTRPNVQDTRRPRRGAVLPLFAIMLPVLLLLAGFAVNVAYMQLTRTELRVATDASARAAGRAFSEFQSVDQAISFAQSTAQLNRVAGQPLSLNTTDDTGDIRFGQSSRTGSARYTFTQRSTAAVRSQALTASAIRILGRRNSGSSSGTVSLPFRLFGAASTFQPTVDSICTQVDRDIALILDRSGSMAESMYDWTDFYHYEDQIEWYWHRGRWRSRTVSVQVWTPPEMEARYDTFLAEYDDWDNNGGPAPEDSRWAGLVQAVDTFLDVLDATDQQERVSVATFSTTSTLNLSLQTTYGPIRTLVDGIRPSGWTAIGQGMQTGLPSLYAAMGRPYAAKTIVVLTDGINNQSPDPVTVANTIAGDYEAVIHTVTLSADADENTMQQVADIGHGNHYHAEDLDELVDIFREIANNLPTILTQ